MYPAAAPPSPASALTSDDSDDSLKEVTVNGVRTLLHDKVAESEQKAPQSITVVSRKLMAAQGTNRSGRRDGGGGDGRIILFR